MFAWEYLWTWCCFKRTYTRKKNLFSGFEQICVKEICKTSTESSWRRNLCQRIVNTNMLHLIWPKLQNYHFWSILHKIVACAKVFKIVFVIRKCPLFIFPWIHKIYCQNYFFRNDVTTFAKLDESIWCWQVSQLVSGSGW